MVTAMLVAAIHAGALAAAAGGDVHALPHPPPLVTNLPMDGIAAWPMRRCGDGVPASHEATAAAAIDVGCARLVVRDRATVRDHGRRRLATSDSDGSQAWRLAQLVLPGLQGMVGRGGFGLGLGGELQLVRGAHMTLHLAAARDTRIADTAFAPETTVLARCETCWDESEATGAGLLSVERRAPSSVSHAPRL